MTPYLLDVNVLLPLVDPRHIHHAAAHQWFGDKARLTWATCPITENGFVRVLSQPAYPNRPGDASTVLAVLRELCAAEGHEFWSDDVSLRDVVQPDAVITHRHVTDVYLLGLAIHHGGRLATFDGRISTAVIRGGAAAVELIPA
jgi:toxin-antitoxin system PIN domain toxin